MAFKKIKEALKKRKFEKEYIKKAKSARVSYLDYTDADKELKKTAASAYTKSKAKAKVGVKKKMAKGGKVEKKKETRKEKQDRNDSVYAKAERSGKYSRKELKVLKKEPMMSADKFIRESKKPEVFKKGDKYAKKTKGIKGVAQRVISGGKTGYEKDAKAILKDRIKKRKERVDAFGKKMEAGGKVESGGGMFNWPSRDARNGGKG